jgi:hypothetical protein
LQESEFVSPKKRDTTTSSKTVSSSSMSSTTTTDYGCIVEVASGGSSQTRAIVQLDWNTPRLAIVHAVDARHTVIPEICLRTGRIVYQWLVDFDQPSSSVSSRSSGVWFPSRRWIHPVWSSIRHFTWPKPRRPFSIEPIDEDINSISNNNEDETDLLLPEPIVDNDSTSSLMSLTDSPERTLSSSKLAGTTTTTTTPRRGQLRTYIDPMKMIHVAWTDHSAAGTGRWLTDIKLPLDESFRGLAGDIRVRRQFTF